MSWYRSWRPYVPVEDRRAAAAKKMSALEKKGVEIRPVELEGRTIARTFWGKAWCRHLESFSDYANRLPRGRTYVRNGSVCHLDITPGRIHALVSGSSLYTVEIAVPPLAPARWSTVKRRCAGHIGSLLELLQGRLSEQVLSVVTDPAQGLFPQPGDMTMTCSCPDWATMCKHVAAALYGAGARLDLDPELLFRLRGVDHAELIAGDLALDAVDADPAGGRRRLADHALADVFGIDLVAPDARPTAPPPPARAPRRGPPSTPAPAKPSPRSATKTKPSPPALPRRSERPSPNVQATRRPDPGSRRAAARTPPPDPVAFPPEGTLTGPEVAALRNRLGLGKAAFARLLGVSDSSVHLWEKNSREINFQARIRVALRKAQTLTPREAARLRRL